MFESELGALAKKADQLPEEEEEESLSDVDINADVHLLTEEEESHKR